MFFASSVLGVRLLDVPIYEYQCLKCGHRFEKMQKFSDPPVKKCPECGGKVQQLISSPAVQFKGSGWYVTDYAKKGSSGKSESKGEKVEAASESKPASDSTKSEGDSKPHKKHKKD